MNIYWMKKNMGLAALALTLAFGACAAPPEAEVPPELIAPVSASGESEAVIRGDIARVEVYRASIKAREEEVFFDKALDGYVVRRFEKAEGDLVQAGDAIVRLDVEMLERELTDLERQIGEMVREAQLRDEVFTAEVKIAEFELEIASAEGADAKEIALMGIEMERQGLLHQQTQNGERRVRGRLERRAAEIRELIRDSVLYATKDGVIARMNVQRGEAVSYRVAAVVIVDPAAMFIEADSSNVLRNNSLYQYDAVIGQAVYPVVFEPVSLAQQAVYTQGGKANPARLLFEGAVPEDVQVGQFLYVHATEAEAFDTLLVPRNAVFAENSAPYVYRMVDDGSGNMVKENVPVQLGVINESFAEILSGLAEGDVIFVK